METNGCLFLCVHHYVVDATALAASTSLLGSGADAAAAGKGEWREIGFETWDLTSGKCVIGGGVAWVRKAASGEKAKL